MLACETFQQTPTGGMWVLSEFDEGTCMYMFDEQIRVFDPETETNEFSTISSANSNSLSEADGGFDKCCELNNDVSIINVNNDVLFPATCP